MEPPVASGGPGALQAALEEAAGAGSRLGPSWLMGSGKVGGAAPMGEGDDASRLSYEELCRAHIEKLIAAAAAQQVQSDLQVRVWGRHMLTRRGAACSCRPCSSGAAWGGHDPTVARQAAARSGQIQCAGGMARMFRSTSHATAPRCPFAGVLPMHPLPTSTCHPSPAAPRCV